MRVNYLFLLRNIEKQLQKLGSLHTYLERGLQYRYNKILILTKLLNLNKIIENQIQI
jgi:hypothetical protein